MLTMSSSTQSSFTLATSAQPRTLLGLSSDVWLEVSDHLNVSDLNSLARTCKMLYEICNWEVYKRDTRSDNPQALLWGVFSNQIRPMELAISQHGADINKVFRCPPTSRHFTNEIKAVAIANGVNVSTTHITRVSFRGSDDVGHKRWQYEGGWISFDRRPSSWTALHFAALFNHVEAAEFLLQHGADVWAVCPRDGYFVLEGDNEPSLCTPLFTAIKTKSEEVAEVLLRHGASPLWFPPGTGQHKKETALYLAAHLGMWKILEPIVHAGVDVTAGCHVDDLRAWSTDTASQPILLKLASSPRKPTEEVIAELARLGGRASVRDLPGRNNMIHLLIRLIIGLKEGKVIKPNWPLASIMLRAGACDGTLEEVETLAAIQLALFPRNCPYTPNHTRHTMPDLTYFNKKPRMYSVKASLVGNKCKCRLHADQYPADDKENGKKWQIELLQELVNFQVRHYGWKYLEGPLPFLAETVLTLLARHQRVNTAALDTWLSLMPPNHKTKVTNVRRQTALHIVLNIESFEEKLWYAAGHPTTEVNPYFDQQHDIVFYLLNRCTSDELLARDHEGVTPLMLLLGALYWDQDPKYEYFYPDDDVWAKKCLVFVEKMVSAIPEMSDIVYQRVFEELHWRRWELGCDSGLIYVGREGATGKVPHFFPSYKPGDREIRPLPKNHPLPPAAVVAQLDWESTPAEEPEQPEEAPQQAEAPQTAELSTLPAERSLPDDSAAKEATAENTVADHAEEQQSDASSSSEVAQDDGIDWDSLMDNIQEEADNAWAQDFGH